MTRNTRPLRLLTIVLLGLTVTGCAAIRPDPPQVQLAGLQISDLSLSHANFLATLSLYNPNSKTLDIEGLQFTLFLDKVQVASGKTAKSFSIPAEQTGTADLRLAASFTDLFRLARKLKGIDEMPFRIAGDVRIGGPGFLWITVPIDTEGTVPLGGVLGEIFAEPREFWREPERLQPGGMAPPDSSNPTGR